MSGPPAPGLGADLRGRVATQRSKKCSGKVLGRVLGKGSQKGSEKGACYGFCSKKGVLRRVLRRCLERILGEYSPLGVRPSGARKSLQKVRGQSPKTLSDKSLETLQRLPGLSPRLFGDIFETFS